MLRMTVAGSLLELAEVLTDELVGHPDGAADDPFVSEIIAVPSAGVRDWVGRRLAERTGVLANVEFVFPATLVDRVVASDPTFGGWAVGPLTWAIYSVWSNSAVDVHPPGLLAAPPGHPGPSSDDGPSSAGSRAPGRPAAPAHVDALRARAVADLFDRYSLYRPAMVRAWSDGRDVGATGAPIGTHQRWQPALWRAVQAHLGGVTDAERRAQWATAAHEMRLGDGALSGWPGRVFVFGLASMPPPHLEVLGALARHREVHFLAPTVSPARWRWIDEHLEAPVAWPRRRADANLPPGLVEADPSARPDRTGHPLVASWGRTSREADLALIDAARHHPDALVVPPDQPAPPTAGASVLARLQHAVSADLAATGDRPPLDPQDQSIRWLRTYGPARQVEVLRDALVHLLEERAPDGSARFEPRDIAVLCPDPARVAPLVEAAFAGDPDHGVPGLPVVLADRSLRQESPLLEVAASLMDLIDGRFRISQVMALAYQAPVRDRFGLTTDSLARIGQWLTETNVKWGLDAGSQQRFGLPEAMAGVHTWRAGLDQLLLGAAMAPGEDRLGLGQVVPYDAVEGNDDLSALGGLAELIGHLDVAVARLGQPASMVSWCRALGEVLRSMTLVSDREAWQWRTVERTLDELIAEASLDGEPRSERVDPRDLAELVRGRLTTGAGRPRFGSGAITLSSLTAQRGVPYRVVCLLGLDDDGAAGGLAAADDLIAAEPCLGDHDARSEQRAQLLDAVRAAGERLIITSTGHDLRTNAELPPPVVLAELFDAIDALVAAPPGCPDGPGSARGWLTGDHPRQAWAEVAFTDGALGVAGPWSFDDGARAAAMARRRQRPAEPWLVEPLPAPAPTDAADPDAVPTVAIDQLIEACTNPAKVLVAERLGVSWPSPDGATSDLIPLTMGGLDRWKLTKALLDQVLGTEPGGPFDEERWAEIQRRRGVVPPLAFGDDDLNRARSTVDRLRGVVTVELGGAAYRPSSLPIEVSVGADGDEVILAGPIAGVCDSRVITVTPSRLRAKDWLTAWVTAAVLGAGHPGPAWSVLVIGLGSNGDPEARRVQIVEPERAREALEVVVDLYRRALCDAVPAFPETTRALFDGDPGKARRAWSGQNGEAQDRWAARLFPADFDLLMAQPLRAGENPEDHRSPSRVEWWAERIWGAVYRTATLTEIDIGPEEGEP